MAFFADKEVVEGRAQWRCPGMKSRLGTQYPMDLSESVVVGGTGTVMSARVTEARNRISGQGSAEAEERLHKDWVSHAKGRELSAWAQFEVASPTKKGAYSKAVVDARLALTWKVVGGKETEGATCGRGQPGPTFDGGRYGYRGARRRAIVTFAGDILGCAQKM